MLAGVSSSTSSDSTLLRSWGGGDPRAGDRLFRRHAPAVTRFFRNKISSDLEDLVQQTFLRGLAARTNYRSEGPFCAYLLGIAYYVLIDYYRATSRAPAALDVDEISAHDLCPSPSLVVAERREHQLLLLALRRLPLIHQVALELHYWEGMTSREIAETLGIPHGTAQTRIARGRELIAAHVEQLRRAVGIPQTQTIDLEAWASELRASFLAAGG
jgi:RNA polymerase sigma factor (sigma-70 family)